MRFITQNLTDQTRRSASTVAAIKLDNQIQFITPQNFSRNSKIDAGGANVVNRAFDFKNLTSHVLSTDLRRKWLDNPRLDPPIRDAHGSYRAWFALEPELSTQS